MDKDIYTAFIHLQNSFTKELFIQSKIILEEITQVGSDITLLIENCKRIHYVYIIYLIDLVNIIKEKDKDHQGKTAVNPWRLWNRRLAPEPMCNGMC